jgi:hypothetical protein
VSRDFHPDESRCECAGEDGDHEDSCPAMFGACGDCPECGSLNPSTCGCHDEEEF